VDGRRQEDLADDVQQALLSWGRSCRGQSAFSVAMKKDNGLPEWQHHQRVGTGTGTGHMECPGRIR